MLLGAADDVAVDDVVEGLLDGVDEAAVELEVTVEVVVTESDVDEVDFELNSCLSKAF